MQRIRDAVLSGTRSRSAVAALPIPDHYRAVTVHRDQADMVEGMAVHDVHRNVHRGKVGVLAPAPEEGLGVTDLELRARRLAAIDRFRLG
jgi:crotonyl-CoA reductase